MYQRAINGLFVCVYCFNLAYLHLSVFLMSIHTTRTAMGDAQVVDVYASLEIDKKPIDV